MKPCRAVWICSLVFFFVGPLWAADTANTFVFTNADLELLKQVELLDQKYERDGLVSHDEALNAYVTRVGLSMLPAGTAPEHVKWAFRVLRDPTPNAFALPNGSVYVHTGLLSILENEDQLAGVLAHEITHVTDRHGYLSNRDYRKKSTVISLAEFAGRMAPGGTNWGTAVELASVVAPVIMTASIFGYRRELEHNADVYSYNKLVEGNYDPRQMPLVFGLLEKKDEAEADAPKTFYADHPALEDRITYMNSLIASKAPPPTPAEVLAERKMRYQSLTEAVVREDIHLAILSNHPRTAVARASKLTAFHPDSADNIYVLAESYRSLGPWTPRPTEQELTGGGKRQSESLKNRFTPVEEERQLLSTSSGQSAWRDNERLAEESYQKALAINPEHAKTYLGLGQLYEKEEKSKEALAAYQKYIELSPNAFDQTWVKQRISALQRSVGQ